MASSPLHDPQLLSHHPLLLKAQRVWAVSLGMPLLNRVEGLPTRKYPHQTLTAWFRMIIAFHLI
jgi:hypothetical protein